MTKYDSIIFTKKQYERWHCSGSALLKDLQICFAKRKLLFLGCSLEKDRTVETLRRVIVSGMQHFAILEYKADECKEAVNVRIFIKAVKKYTDMTQLDTSVLREFVEQIYISDVYTPDESDPRVKVREIQIVYNFIGAFDFEKAREQSKAAQQIAKVGVA